MTVFECKRLLQTELNYQEAVSILQLVTGLDPLKQSLNGSFSLDEDQEKRITEILKRRLDGYPLQYLLGSWSFMGRDYCVGEGVLIPRDDTEVVIRAVEDHLNKNNDIKIIDLCSGSGIIAVTLKERFKNAEVHAAELSDLAVTYLQKNVQRLSPEIIIHHGDITELYAAFDDGYFDLIISNPPYIPACELETLQTEVRYEPRLALNGGSDGMDFYRLIMKLWTSKLRNGGMIAFELGESQFETIKNYLLNAGFHDIKGYKDFGNAVRAVTAVYGE